MDDAYANPWEVVLRMLKPNKVEKEYRIETHRDCQELGGQLSESIGEMIGDGENSYVSVKVEASVVKDPGEVFTLEGVYDDVAEEGRKVNAAAENND